MDNSILLSATESYLQTAWITYSVVQLVTVDLECYCDIFQSDKTINSGNLETADV
jgi:hypothetical protein